MKSKVMCIASLAVFTFIGPILAAESRGPLEDYVAKKDASCRWVVRREGSLEKTSCAELTLTSQTWRGIVWRHQLYVIKPENVKPDTKHALLMISGGNWRNELARPTESTDWPGHVSFYAEVAKRMNAPVAVLHHVPRQPMFGGLVEDQIISLTFEEYLKTGEADRVLLLPMVKSAVKAMDALQQFAEKRWSLRIEKFTVSGASKRGWTTWLTAAVDDRAAAIAPQVIDMLNMGSQMKHQVAVWGDYSPMIRDYTDRQLPKFLDTPRGRSLQQVVDPYQYRKRLTMPKLILLGTNDPYWPVDALNLYWDDLAGEKYILYVPNSGHGLRDVWRVYGTINALHQHVANGKRLPKLSWKLAREKNRASLRIASDLPPEKVVIWTATAPKRDFRRARWESYPTRKDGAAYVGELDVPETGYGAMFGEAMYKMGDIPFYFSTTVAVGKAQ